MAEFFWNQSKMATRAQLPSVNVTISIALPTVTLEWARTRRVIPRPPQKSTEIDRGRPSKFRQSPKIVRPDCPS